MRSRHAVPPGTYAQQSPGHVHICIHARPTHSANCGDPLRSGHRRGLRLISGAAARPVGPPRFFSPAAAPRSVFQAAGQTHAPHRDGRGVSGDLHITGTNPGNLLPIFTVIANKSRAKASSSFFKKELTSCCLPGIYSMRSIAPTMVCPAGGFLGTLHFFGT